MSLSVYTAAALGSDVFCTFRSGSPKNFTSAVVRFQIDAIHICAQQEVWYTLREEDSCWTIDVQHSNLVEEGGHYRYDCYGQTEE